MNRWSTVMILAVLSSAGLCRDEAQGSPPESRIVVDIRAQSALSYSSDRGQSICEYTKPAVTLYRVDAKGAKVKGLTLSGDSGRSESPAAGEMIGRLTLKGNVRGESPGGGVVRADAAELDLGAGTFTFTGRLESVMPEK